MPSIGGRSWRDATLRPDLVIKRPVSVPVVDVTLPFENKESLHDAAHIKVSKYLPVLPTVKDTMHATNTDVIPMVMGTRRVMP